MNKNILFYILICCASFFATSAYAVKELPLKNGIDSYLQKNPQPIGQPIGDTGKGIGDTGQGTENNSKGGSGIKDGVDSAAITIFTTHIYKSTGAGTIPTTDQDKINLKIAASILQIGLKPLDLVYPGVGSILSAISAGLFDGMIPKEDPNKPIVDALASVERKIEVLDGSLNSGLAGLFKEKSDSIIAKQSEQYSKVESIIKTYETEATLPDEYKPQKSYIRAMGIDLKINDGQLTTKTVNSRYTADTLKQIVETAVTLGNRDTFKRLTTTLNEAAAAERKNVKTDNFNTLGENYIGINRLSAYNAFHYAEKMSNKIDRIRLFFHGMAYLKYLSVYKDRFDIHVVNIPGFDIRASKKDKNNDEKNYISAIKAVDDYFEKKEKKLMEASKTYTASVTHISNDLAAKLSKEHFATTTGESIDKPCNVTYWDGKNIVYSCKTPLEDDGREFILGDVQGTCGKNLITRQNDGNLSDSKNFPIYGCMLSSVRDSSGNIPFSTSTKAPKLRYSQLMTTYYSDRIHSWQNLVDKDIYMFGQDSSDYIDEAYKGFKSGINLSNFNSSTSDVENAAIIEIDFRFKNSSTQRIAGPAFVAKSASGTNSAVYYRDEKTFKPYKLLLKNIEISKFFCPTPLSRCRYYSVYAYAASLGCLISNCRVQYQNNKLIGLRFDDGYAVKLEPAPWFNSESDGLVHLSQSWEAPYKDNIANNVPGGDWVNKCNGVILTNGWLSALCKYDSNSLAAPIKSTINLNNCPEKDVTVNQEGHLQCQ